MRHFKITYGGKSGYFAETITARTLNQALREFLDDAMFDNPEIESQVRSIEEVPYTYE